MAKMHGEGPEKKCLFGASPTGYKSRGEGPA